MISFLVMMPGVPEIKVALVTLSLDSITGIRLAKLLVSLESRCLKSFKLDLGR